MKEKAFMAITTCLLTGVCLIVLGLRARIPPGSFDPADPPRLSEQVRRLVVTGFGMAAVLLALYLFGH